MAENSKIQWCDATFNPWRGCTRVSPGCRHCYAETTAKRNPAVLGEWGPNGTRVIAPESYWRQPLKWDREAEAAGVRRRVFCASLADVFEDRPDLVGPRLRLFRLIAVTPNLDWLLLTKRPEVAAVVLPYLTGVVAGELLKLRAGNGELTTNQQAALDAALVTKVFPNVWLGVSAEDQARADERIPVLLDTPAAVRFVSYEPALGPVDFSKWLNPVWCDVCGPGFEPLEVTRTELSGSRRVTETFCAACHAHDPEMPSSVSAGEAGIDWLIAGGESGPGARPCDIAWIRSAVRQCREAGVPAFVKQLGARPFDGCRSVPTDPDAVGDERIYLSLRDPKGGDMAEWPEDLRVREWPAAAGKEP